MEEKSLKERFDEAFYGLLEAGKNLNEVNERLKIAGKMIRENQRKQQMIDEILNAKL